MASKLVEANHPNACPLPWLPCAGAPDLQLASASVPQWPPPPSPPPSPPPLSPPPPPSPGRRRARHRPRYLRRHRHRRRRARRRRRRARRRHRAVSPLDLLLLPCYHFINYPSSELTASL